MNLHVSLPPSLTPSLPLPTSLRAIQLASLSKDTNIRQYLHPPFDTRLAAAVSGFVAG